MSEAILERRKLKICFVWDQGFIIVQSRIGKRNQLLSSWKIRLEKMRIRFIVFSLK